MEKIKLTIIGIIIISISFYLTNTNLNKLMENDPIMKEIKKKEEKYEIKSIDAEIIGNTIISGKKGRKVDEKKSYSKMKKYGTYNEALTEVKSIKPVISIEDNYDKYIIKGNEEKRQISIVFPINEKEQLESLISILKSKNTIATFFIDGTLLERSALIIKNNPEFEYEILNYQNTYKESLLKTSMSYLETITKKRSSFCYTQKDNDKLLEFCKKSSLHTIKPTLSIKKELYKTIKQKISNAMIISITDNKYTEKELPMIIDYIEKKNFSIVLLEELIKE